MMLNDCLTFQTNGNRVTASGTLDLGTSEQNAGKMRRLSRPLIDAVITSRASGVLRRAYARDAAIIRFRGIF